VAINEVAGREADQRLVFVFSDADLARYAKDPADWSAILTSTSSSVSAYAVLIASNESEAESIRASLAAGRGHVCTDTDQLAPTFERILHASVRGLQQQQS